MNTCRWSSRVLTGLLLQAALVMPLQAQSRLYVLDEGDNNYHAVHKVVGGQPYVMQDGRLAPTRGDRFMLKKVPEFLPVLIEVRDWEARTEHQPPLVDVGTPPLNEFHFSAKFESSYALDNVFLVLELEFSDKNAAIFVHEIGQLRPHAVLPFDLRLPAEKFLGAGQLKLHLFVAGDEVFHTRQPADFREAALDRMVADRLAGVKDAPPRPFFSVDPEYPPALRGSGVRGEAVIAMHITAQGRVKDPAVVSASAPAFGESALEAVRQWRLLPQVKAGQPVEIQIRLPFEFGPPVESGKD